MTTSQGPLLYNFPISYNGQKVLLGLEEKGFKYQTKDVNILTGQNLNPDYLKINANGTVPALQLEDGRILTESADILRYADSQGEPLGGDKVDRTIVDFWYDRTSNWDANLFTFQTQSVGNLLNNFRIKVAEARIEKYPELREVLQKRLDFFRSYTPKMVDPAEKEKVDSELKELLDAGESNLSKTSFIAGEAYSMADAVVTNLLVRTEMNGKKEYITSRPSLSKYFDAMKLRPNYKKVVAAYDGLGGLPIILPTLATIFFKKITHTY